ncbi:hypothetical protein [uncultured Mediterranean phage uvDeep-CGR2-KM23-C246]|nr:hypothetical protein [uncultured Mediterranean phage uvDeep-CGR2-KM23-C246]
MTELTPEILQQLAAPYSSEVIHWRVGSTTKDNKRGMALAYIDARDVMDRLDEVVPGEWHNRFEEVAGRITCLLTICGVTRSDGAGDTAVEAEKGGLSDAFKRSAVMFGIGRYLYRLPSEWVALDAKKRIMDPPVLPGWALPSGEVGTDIPFDKIETEDQIIAQREESEAAQELIRAIEDLESSLINKKRMSEQQRSKVRGKYAKVIKLEAATVDDLATYYDQLVTYRKAQ